MLPGNGLSAKATPSSQSILIALNLTLHRLLRMARLCRDLRHVHQIAQGSEGFARWIIQLGVDGLAVPGIAQLPIVGAAGCRLRRGSRMANERLIGLTYQPPPLSSASVTALNETPF